MASNLKILIIDDDAFIRRVLELKLTRQGHEVREAKNGQEGLDIIIDWQPDAVISDINMPIMDGQELCQRTNALKGEQPFLTIMVTARINPEDKSWVQSMSDTVFMEKPFSPAKIMDCINAYFEERN